MLSLAAVYLIGAIITYGCSLAYWQREWPEQASRNRRRDLLISLLFGVLWIYAWAIWIGYRPRKHGFLLWPTMGNEWDASNRLRGAIMTSADLENARIGRRSQAELQRELLQTAPIHTHTDFLDWALWQGAGTQARENSFPRDAIQQAVREQRRHRKRALEEATRAQNRLSVLHRAVKGNITLPMILEETNQEIRRTMLDRYGFERFMEDVGATVVMKDEWGELLEWKIPASWATTVGRFTPGWMFRDRPEEARRRIADPNVFKAVRVVNSSPEPDGSYRKYLLRVPHWTETPREGIAWSFGYENAEDYCPEVMT